MPASAAEGFISPGDCQVSAEGSLLWHSGCLLRKSPRMMPVSPSHVTSQHDMTRLFAMTSTYMCSTQ